jgi:hypothetical protein
MDQLNAALGVLVELIKSTKDFVGDQAPRVAQEVEWAIFLGIVLFCLLAALKACIKVMKEDSDFVPPFVFTIIGLVIVAPLFVCCLDNAVKAKVAPRVVILDYLEGKLKSCNNK